MIEKLNSIIDYLFGCMIRFYVSLAAIIISPIILFLYILGLIRLGAEYKSEENDND
jgi:hypothetical protein